MRYLAIVVLALVLTGCTQEQDKKAGDTLSDAAKVVTVIKEVVKEVPVPGNTLVEKVLAGAALALGAAGTYFTNRARQKERAKKKAYKKGLSKEALDNANKKLYGKNFDVKLSKF
jgi:PBP1b-binding outer membrane lipoprotein LpoB